MKGKLLILALALSPSAIWYRQAPALPSALGGGSTVADELSLAQDGTATVTGTVIENNHGCRVDGACYLLLRVGNQRVRVIYHPGEGEGPINSKALKQGAAVIKGARIKAYGRYRKRGTLATIETYTSETFYIHVVTSASS